jgi:hypothetical protein
MKDDIEQWFINQDIPYVRPFYTCNPNDDQDVLKWFVEIDGELNQYYRALFREQRDNLKLFLGSGLNPKYLSAEVADFVNYNSDQAQSPGLYINELYRYTMDQVSLIVSNELTPQVIPNNDDFNDKLATKVTKNWLDSMNYDMDTEINRIRWEIQKKVFGEAFVVVEWDPEAGDIHPASRAFMKEDLDYVDKEGKHIYAKDGKTKLKLRKNIRVGDIAFENPAPYNTFIEPATHFNKANYFYWVTHEDVAYLRKKYKDKTFTTNEDMTIVDDTSGALKFSPNQKRVFNFYHRSHEFLPEGRHIVCTEDNMLVNEPLKSPELINSKKLPLVRFYDLDYGFGVRGVPILYRSLKNIADCYNKVSNQIFNNIDIESPKIFVHVSAGFDGRRMPTGIAVFEWEGSHPPTIVTPTSNTSAIFKFRDDLKRNMDEMARQTTMVRGDVPNSQLDSAVALQHFEDLRVQLAAPDIKGHIKAMEWLFRLMIVRARDHYEPEDGRLIKIMGKHNVVSLKYFHPDNLLRSYDVKITTTGNLANTKAARTQMMMTIKKEFPNIIQDELFIDVLGLSHSEKFTNAITNAISTAEAENEDMLNGVSVALPARYEDLITHWDSHRIPMQTLDFKVAPRKIQDLFVAHVTATEKLMYEVARESPMFANRMSNLKQFPLFYTPTPINAPQEPVLGGGNDNGGEMGVAPNKQPMARTPSLLNEDDFPQFVEAIESKSEDQLSPV